MPQSMSLNIFVVDDEPSIGQPLGELLTRNGHRARVFTNAPDALSYIPIDHPDIIFTDIKMPQMDGITFLRILRANHPDIATVIMTAHADIRNAVDAMKLGAYEYMAKPFSQEVPLLHIISITEKINIRKRLKELDNQARMVRTAKTFARIGANVAHLFGNKLTPIKNINQTFANLVESLQQLQKTPDDNGTQDRAKRYIEKAPALLEDSNRYLEDAKKTLDMWWKLSGYKQDERPYPLHPQDCLNAAILLVQHELYSNNTITVDISQKLPTMFGNFNNITRLFINILFNATDSIARRRAYQPTHHGSISITMAEAPDKKIITTITDNGEGMQQDTLDRISQHFETSADVFQTTATGFDDCRAILAQYRDTWQSTGTITAKSSGTDTGATFVIQLPGE